MRSRLYYSAGNLGVNTDTANMIAATVPWRQHFNEYRDAFPLRDRNLLIVIDAPTPASGDEFAAALLAELRAQPERYRAPLLAGEGEFFERNGLLYLPTAELAALTDRLAGAQPLIGLLKAHFDGAAVLDVARQTLAPANGGDAAALSSFYEELARTIAGTADGADAPLAWDRLIARGAPATTRRIIALQPALDFSRMQPAAAAIADLRVVAARLNAARAEPVTVRLTGSVAMEHEELLSVSRGAGIGALATLVMVALVLYASLRSWRLLAVSLLTLVVGLALTAAFAALAVGQLNLLSVAFVVLNVGLGSDYVIHVLLRYRELTAAGQPVPAALVETVRGVGSSLVLCAVTTAAGFYSFIPTTFSGVSELGLIAGTGVFFGLFASVTLLPALVAWWDAARPGRSAATWLDPRIFAPLSRRPRLVLGATAVVLVAALAALPQVTFDSNPIHLRDPDSESVTTLLELAAAGEAPLLNLVAVAPDRGTALGWATALRTLPEVRGVTTTDQLVPRDQDEKLALLEDLELLMGPDFAELERSPADGAALSAALAELESASAGGAGGARVARGCGELARAASCGRRCGSRRDAGSTRRGFDYRSTARACASAHRVRGASLRSHRSAGPARGALARERRPRARRDHAGRGRQRQRGGAAFHRRRPCHRADGDRVAGRVPRSVGDGRGGVRAGVALCVHHGGRDHLARAARREGHAARARADRARIDPDGGADGCRRYAVQLREHHRVAALGRDRGGQRHPRRASHAHRRRGAIIRHEHHARRARQRPDDRRELRQPRVLVARRHGEHGHTACDRLGGEHGGDSDRAAGVVEGGAATTEVRNVTVALVTGANGFLGSAVVRALLADGSAVRAFVRPGSDRRNLVGLDVDVADGDLTDRDSLTKAAAGCEAVFHVAADYRLWVADAAPMYRANVEGSVNVLEAAAAAGAARMVYTSSVAVLGINKTNARRRNHTGVGDDMVGHYKRSKFLAEQAVRERAGELGFPVVTVNPSTPIGPRDIKPTPTGRILLDAAAGRMPAFVDTGLNLVHVDDVAQGHLLACEAADPASAMCWAARTSRCSRSWSSSPGTSAAERVRFACRIGRSIRWRWRPRPWRSSRNASRA